MSTARAGRSRRISRRLGERHWTATSLEELAQRVFEQMKNAPAMLSLEELDAAERRLAATAETRRAALRILSTPGALLVDRVERDRDFAIRVAGIFECLSGCIDDQKGLSELLDCARARIVVALCARLDVDQVIAEARRRTTS